jgi:hypothetical protein
MDSTFTFQTSEIPFRIIGGSYVQNFCLPFNSQIGVYH